MFQRVDPQSVPVSLVGGKAHKLLELNWCAQVAPFLVPRFCILPATLCEAYNNEFGRTPPVLGTPLPDPNRVDKAIVAYYDHFYHAHTELLEKCVAGLNHITKPFVRSSLSLDTTDTLSFAGVNYTFSPSRPVPPSKTYLNHAISEAFAAMYRPYTTWYLYTHNLSQLNRSASLILCEGIDMQLAGTIYVIGEMAQIDFEDAAGYIVDSFVFCLTERPKWPSHSSQYGDRLQSAIKALIDYLQSAFPLEVEFCFNTDGELYFIQYRPLNNLARNSDELLVNRQLLADTCNHHPAPYPPIYQTTGHIEGPICNLLNTPRIPQTIDRVLKQADTTNDTIWLVHEHNQKYWDGFALMWVFSQHQIVNRHRMILYSDTHRQRTHLPIAMRDMPNLDFLVHVSSHKLASLPTGTPIQIKSYAQETLIRA
jgi:hypothetical protein